MYSRNNVITTTNSLWGDKITTNSVIGETVMCYDKSMSVTVFDAIITLKRKRLSLREKVDILDYRKNN